jgi:hypothetical protein
MPRPGWGRSPPRPKPTPLLGIQGLELLERHRATETVFSPDAAQWVLDVLLHHDGDRQQRQVHLVDHNGHAAAWTGADCEDWAGHQTFDGFSVAGNMLVGPQVLTAMATAYHSHLTCPLGDRLLRALEAGDAAGGDKRGRQSAALYVMDQTVYPPPGFTGRSPQRSHCPAPPPTRRGPPELLPILSSDHACPLTPVATHPPLVTQSGLAGQLVSRWGEAHWGALHN